MPAPILWNFAAGGVGKSFDFLTCFEYASSDAAAFDELVGRLRGSSPLLRPGLLDP